MKLSDTVSLRAGMARKRVLDSMETLTGKPMETDDPLHATMASSAAFPFMDGQAACVCHFSRGRLRTVELFPCGGTAETQRRQLLECIGRQDADATDGQSVRLRYGFGTVWIIADPRVGDVSLRVTYTAKE